ncbi:hypothetical protein SCHPADRAFT_348868 [Schizopora paradoxa]|uniref:DUF6533 domain-containing protein n=1 Tax=Schizopora paradoxa TaxID=27342 RepID=A0A0H2SA00_9AGAM|nr:hypothetical protein SCHPADRAFT_348868 [Schizopora paradoxa]
MSIQPGQVEQALVVNYVNVCSLTLLVYDACLKFEEELKYIWRKDWTFLKCVYIGSKYLAFVDGALTVVLLLQPGLKPHSCSVLYKTVIYLIWFGVVLAEAIIQCHAWVIWGLSKYDTSFTLSPLPNIRPCLPDESSSQSWAHIYITFLCIMVAEINVLVLMLWRKFMEFKYLGGGKRIALLQILYRDGMIYVFCLLALSAGHSVLDMRYWLPILS